MDFSDIKRHLYQQVPCSPGEPKPNQLVFSDIVAHLPVLEYYSSLCNHVTEFGVREGQSTVALLAGNPGVVHSWDIERCSAVRMLSGMILPTRWEFHQGDTGIAQPVEETDFLFFDTLHTYEHLKKELALFARKARRFIGFHDTHTCGLRDVSGPDPNAKGILPAIEEFLACWPGEYTTVYRTNTNNGLWILGRIP